MRQSPEEEVEMRFGEESDGGLVVVYRGRRYGGV